LRLIDVKTFIKEYGIKSLVCCFSGGKDSLAMTHFVMSEIREFESPIGIHVVFVDTGVMLPVTVKYVEKVCAEQGWPLRILRPKQNFWELAERWGCPSPNRRWCCRALKLDPIRDFVVTLPPQRGECVGIKWCDSRKRSKLRQIQYKRRSRSWGYLPIVDWTDEQVWAYIRRHRLPEPPHYRMGIPETCVCGAFGHKKEWMALRAHFPGLFAKFVDLEKRLRPGRTAFYDKGQRLSTKEILAQKTLEEFM